jgi:hypothetical protein
MSSRDRSSQELRRLLGKVEERLLFYHQRCMSLAAARGAILTELLRRGEPVCSENLTLTPLKGVPPR